RWSGICPTWRSGSSPWSKNARRPWPADSQLDVVTFHWVRTKSPFWPRRLRWHLLAAWRWPALILITLADGAIIAALPPSGAHAKYVPSTIIAMFGNLFFVGAVAPWLAKRLAARRGAQPAGAQFPPVDSGEILV